VVYVTSFKAKKRKNKRKSKPPNLLKWFFRGALKPKFIDTSIFFVL